MDKLRAMKFFCRAVEAGTFAAAAQALDVVPSALSRIITSLEHELAFKLMNRSTRRLSLTEEGARYYEQCRVLLESIEAIEADGRAGLHQLKGTLRIGMHPGLRVPILASVGRFLDANVLLKVETEITNSPSDVLDRGLDLVVHIGTPADSSLVARRLGWTRSVTCASPAYLRSWGIPTDPLDLVRHRAVIYGRQDEEPNTTWTFSRGTERRRVDVPVSVVARDGIGLTDAALGGGGIARPFDIAVRHLFTNGSLQPVLDTWTSPRYAISAILPGRAGKLSARTEAFIEHLAALLG